MKIDRELLRNLEQLSYLRIEKKEEANYLKDIKSILDYMDILKEAKLDLVEPLVHGVPLEEHFREDEALSLSEEKTKKILSCAPDTLYMQYKVPPMLGDKE